MKIETEKDSVCVNKIIRQKTEMVMIEGDAIVPDIKPDIISTINTSGNICIYKKELLDGKVRIDGSIDVYIMYLSDTEEGNIRGLNTSLDFTQILDIEDCKTDMSIDLSAELKIIDCKVLNGRKVSIKASVEVSTQLHSNEKVNIIKQIIGDEHIQKLNNNISMNSLVGEGNSKAYAKDTLSIDNIDNLAEILKVDLQICNRDNKISYNKVLAKADVQVKIIYLTEDGRINMIESMIPVMGFVDIQDVSDDDMCNMKHIIKNLIIKPNEKEEHTIYVEVEIELICNVYRSRQINIIQDLYSPECDISFTQKSISTMVGMENIRDNHSIKERLSIPEIAGNMVYDVDVKTNITNTKISNNRIIYEGEVKLNFIFASNTSSGIDTRSIDLPLNFEIGTNNINSSSNINTDIEIRNKDFIVNENGEIDTRIDLGFDANISQMVDMNIIDEIEVEENRNMGKYSVIIYFIKSGDTMWSIAKRFKSTITDICDMNSIENPDKLSIGQQIFIPRYSSRKVIA